MSENKTREAIAVDAISDAVNNFGFNQKEFNAMMSREHRTLQQSFTRMCVEWLKHCGSSDYRYDGRNEASHQMGKAVNEFLDNYQGGLPLI